MIIFFTGQTSQVSAFQRMSAEAEALLSTKRTNFNPIQIEGQIPTWLRQSSDGKVSGMGQFLQAYYDWLVNEYGFTGVNVMNITELMDIDETPEFLLPNFIRSYTPDIEKIYEIPEETRPTSKNIRNTIKNIRTEVYQRKSSEGAFKSLMGSLFSIDSEKIRFSYPKRKLLRLNGGILDWMTDSTYYGATGEYSTDRYTIVGSHLNQGVMQDGKMWQEFSYLLAVDGLDDSNPYYEEVIKETLHPAGLLGLYEKIETYSEGGYVPMSMPLEEIPKVSNYYPYNLQSTITLERCTGCTGDLSISGWRYPTHVYPSWDSDISMGPSANFGSIVLRDFFRLNMSGITTPNDAIGDDCNVACGESGSFVFSYFVDNELEIEPPAPDSSEDFFFSEKTKE